MASASLILSRERTCVPSSEVSEKEQDIVRSKHRLVLQRGVQLEIYFKNIDVLSVLLTCSLLLIAGQGDISSQSLLKY
jgi:hypothetical protein